MMAAPAQSVTSHGAVIATNPARDAFRHMETSGFPYLIQVKSIHTTVATAGATVVVRNTDPIVGTSVAAAPLKPYQPIHRMKTPSAAITRLCPGKAFTFRALPQRVSALKDLGCDLVTLANNHVWDYGLDGLTDTFLTLDEASIPYVGAGNNLDEACRAQYYIANGRKIAIVDATQIERSYTYTKQATKDAPGVLKTLEPNLYCKVISDTKRQADFVIACVHWGTEGNQHYGQDQILLANAYAEAGADVIIGGHTHCLQGMEFIGDVPVFYSLGNYWFATSSNMPSNYDTGLARIEIYRNLSVTYKFIPCVFSGGETVLASEENTGRIIAELNNLSQTVTLSNEGILKKKGE